MQIEFIIPIIILTVWTVYLSLQLYKTNKLFNNLAHLKAGSLRTVLLNVLKAQKASKREFEELYEEIARIDKEKLKDVQKMGLVRFSPFGKEELEQSFSLALLNGALNGVILTSIHTQEKTRVYVKQVTRGKSETELSLEENKAVEKALNS